MRSSLSLLCLLGLIISFVVAAPHPRSVQKRSYRVDRVRNTNFKGYDGPRQLVKAYRKYGVRPPQSLLDRLNAEDAAAKAVSAAAAVSRKKHKHNTTTTTTTTTDAATNTTSTSSSASSDVTGLVENTPTSSDTEYLSPVTIGGQTLNLDFDTGSSDLWVFNTNLPSKEQNGQTLFDPDSSSTFATLEGSTFSISYGDGSTVAGTVGTDTVEIGGATATKQAVELATTVSSSFLSDTVSDGLLGLAYSVLNTVEPQQQNTFFANVMNDLDEPLFAADLRHNASGSYEFGAIDTSKFTGSLNYATVNTTQGFWQFSSNSFAVNGGTTTTNTGANQAIADTGTTLLLVNTDIVNAYYADITGAEYNEELGGVTVPCDTDMPDISLDVGGTMATVSGDFMIFTTVSDSTCYASLQPIDSDLMIFGDVFFKSNYVVFNGGNNTLAFATHA